MLIFYLFEMCYRIFLMRIFKRIHMHFFKHFASFRNKAFLLKYSDRMPFLFSLLFFLLVIQIFRRRALASWKISQGAGQSSKACARLKSCFKTKKKKPDRCCCCCCCFMISDLRGQKKDRWPSGQCTSFTWETRINPSRPFTRAAILMILCIIHSLFARLHLGENGRVNTFSQRLTSVNI